MFKSFVDSLACRKEHFLIFIHHNADPDAICSGVGFGELMKKLNPSSSYSIYSDGLNTSSKRLAQAFDIELKRNLPEDIDESAMIAIFDCSNISQTGKYASWITNSELDAIMVDHHEGGDLLNSVTFNIHDNDSPSTCILIAKGYEELGIIPSPEVATLLISGHLYDSRRFIYGTKSDLLRVVANLLDYGGDYELANSFLQNKMSFGERIARIKAVRRINYRIINNIIIGTSHVGAFESSSARALISLGCDIVFVIAKKEREIRGSARCNSENLVNVGEIVNQLANEYSANGIIATGGGHRNAAGFNLVPKLSGKQQKELLNRFIQLVEKRLVADTDEFEVIIDPMEDI